MSKIRINELARELEVKAHEIIDKLPELGVADKKTHSSSIDDDVADKLRVAFGHEPMGHTPDTAETDEAETPAEVEIEQRAEAKQASGPVETPAALPAEPGSPAPVADRQETSAPPSRPALPIRPPLAGHT